MKNFIGSLTFLLFTLLILQSTYYGQNNYTYGPIRESNFFTSQGNVGIYPGTDHYIGQNAGGPIVEYICFVNWQWNSNNITQFSKLTSINLKFKAEDKKYIDRATLPFSIHKVEANWNDNVDWSYYHDQIIYNTNRKV
ncbi:MAG: hypothetical protein ACM3RX_07040, partial [Methanococcaceae archaeon]